MPIWQICPEAHAALAQQTFPDELVTQAPLAHVALPVHEMPLSDRHAPAASQVLVALGHESGSAALMTLVQVPTEPGTLHAWQVAHRACSQHTPSTQCPVSHVEPSAQTLPRT